MVESIGQRSLALKTPVRRIPPVLTRLMRSGDSRR